MLGIEIRTETALNAYNRVSKELEELEAVALGPRATFKQIDRYNQLHGQIRRRHPDGSIGHLHLQREVVIFDGILTLPAPSKKIPFRLSSKHT